METVYIKPNLSLWVYLDRSQAHQNIFCAWKFLHLSLFAKISCILLLVPSPLKIGFVFHTVILKINYCSKFPSTDVFYPIAFTS